MTILWLKALHVAFVVTWFAGLFYLPRLLVYHAEAEENVVRERLKIMERRLMIMTHIGGSLAAVFGLATLAAWLLRTPGYFAQGWLHAKLALVVLLIGYHVWLVRLVHAFRGDRIEHSSRWLRGFNEIPSVLLIAIVVLTIVRPF